MAKPTYIGQLDQRIRIESSTSSRGTSGQEVLTWATFAECWAAVEYPGTRSGEGVEADQEVSTTAVVFVIRRRDGMNKKMRIVYNEDYYDIENIFGTSRDSFWRVPAKIIE